MKPLCMYALLASVFLAEAGVVVDDASFAFFHATTSFRALFESKGEALGPNCPPQPLPVSLPNPLPEEIQNALQSLDQLANSSVNTSTVPGIVLSVTYRGSNLMTKGYGVSSKEGSSIPLNGDTIFRIGSVSKVFAVLTLYQLYENGYVQSLDDPLVKYSSDFKIHNPFSRADITLRQMASQMSGLPREAPCGNAVGLNVCPLNTQQILNALSNQSLIFPPWTMPSYSNLAYALLGHVLTEAFFHATTYEEYVEKNILQPLRMTNTGFEITDTVKSHMAVGYLPTGDVAPLIDLGWIGPAGQMYSTTNDLNTLAQFFYNASAVGADSDLSESVLSAAFRREMALTMFVNPDRMSGFGTPWELMFYGNYTIRSKGGNVGGYSALFSFIPELQLSINVLFSGGFDEISFTVSAYKSLLPALVPYLSQNQPSTPYPPNPEVYEGEYTVANVVATIKSVQGQLLLQLATSGFYLAYHEPLQMTIFYPTNLAPCLISELQAVLGEWVYFDPPDGTGKSPGFIIPGVASALHWKRTTQ